MVLVIGPSADLQGPLELSSAISGGPGLFNPHCGQHAARKLTHSHLHIPPTSNLAVVDETTVVTL